MRRSRLSKFEETILVLVTLILEMKTQNKKSFNLDNLPYEIAEALAEAMDGFDHEKVIEDAEEEEEEGDPR